jgi:hypothetical protein
MHLQLRVIAPCILALCASAQPGFAKAATRPANVVRKQFGRSLIKHAWAVPGTQFVFAQTTALLPEVFKVEDGHATHVDWGEIEQEMLGPALRNAMARSNDPVMRKRAYSAMVGDGDRAAKNSLYTLTKNGIRFHITDRDEVPLNYLLLVQSGRLMQDPATTRKRGRTPRQLPLFPESD